MKIIKLEIEVPSRRGGTKIIKQAVSLDKKLFKSVDQFILYAKKVCELRDHYALEIDGFAISGQDTVKMLQQGKVYILRICKKKSRRLAQEQLQSQSEESQSESEFVSEIEEDSESEESVLVIPPSKAKISEKINKKQQKNVKIQRKNKIQKESSSSSSSEQDQTPKKIAEKPSQSNKKSEKIIKPEVKPKSKTIERKPKSSSSQSESSEELPHVPKGKVETKPPQKQILTVKPKAVIPPKKEKALIQDSSESESSPSPINQPLKKKQQAPLIQKNQTFSAVKNQPNLKLPPALRNQVKPQPKRFEQHCEQQWLPVDKQKFKKWQDLGHKTFCQPPNKIRFKVIQFDEEKFIPVKSNWIKGEVISVEESGNICLSNVEQEDFKQFKKEFQIPQHNMDELQIWKLFASKQQLEVLLGENKVKQGEKEVNPAKPDLKQAQKDESQKPPQNSIEKFICGQVNFYFSDRNYSTDFFMQLHANSHPQKYIKMSLMLNFPKIKKLLKDEDKLYRYLQEDEKYDSRNYQIDFQNRMIRKKKIQDPRQQHENKRENQVQEEKKRENEVQEEKREIIEEKEEKREEKVENPNEHSRQSMI